MIHSTAKDGTPHFQRCLEHWSAALRTYESHAGSLMSRWFDLARLVWSLLARLLQFTAASRTKSVCMAIRSVDSAHVQCHKGLSRMASSSHCVRRSGMPVRSRGYLCLEIGPPPELRSPHSDRTDAVAIRNRQSTTNNKTGSSCIVPIRLMESRRHEAG